MPQKRRCTITYLGQVQGVGFRWTACRSAGGHDEISGWVGNEPDRSVSLVVEGEKSEIERFLRDLRGRMSRYIVSESATWADATGEFQSFEIRYR